MFSLLVIMHILMSSVEPGFDGHENVDSALLLAIDQDREDISLGYSNHIGRCQPSRIGTDVSEHISM